MIFFRTKFFLISACCLAAAGTASAQLHDTAIIGNGSPGPYRISERFVDSASVKARGSDTSSAANLPWVFVPAEGAILFSHAITIGDTVHVSYVESFGGLMRENRMFTIDTVGSHKTSSTTINGASGSIGIFSQAPSENLEVTGSKTISVSAGSQGATTMDQSLDVQVSGNISNNTQISANLSDKSGTLQGETRELGQIDRVYIEMKNPRYRITAGDQILSLPLGGLINSMDKIKGLSAEYTGKVVDVGLTGAVSGGHFAVEYIRPTQGVQGPYYLHGNGEADQIEPVAGTVSVEVNGKTLQEGNDNDFTVDNDLGTLRFNPSYPVSDGMVAKVSYEYKTFDYMRIFGALKAGLASPDSEFFVRTDAWITSDDANTPLGFSLNDTDRRALAAAGDGPVKEAKGLSVMENDVPARDAITRLYKRDTTGTYFVFAPYNVMNPLDRSGRFEVWFSFVGAGKGEYQDSVGSDIDTIGGLTVQDARGLVYVYRGPGKGDYSIVSTLRAPARSILDETSIGFNLHNGIRGLVELAGTHIDKNTLSSVDEAKDLAGAMRWTLSAGYDSTTIVKASQRLWSRRWASPLADVFERKSTWDLEYLNDSIKTGDLLRLEAASRICSWIRLSGNVGGYFLENTPLAQNLSGRVDLGKGDRFVGDIFGTGITHGGPLAGSWAGRGGGDIGTAFLPVNPSVGGYSEWKRDTLGIARGNIGGNIGAKLKPVDFSEKFTASSDRRGSGSISAATDTGWTTIWEQRLALHKAMDARVEGTTSYQKNRADKSTNSTFLATVIGGFSSIRTGTAGNLNWSISSEKASVFVNVPVYVGLGRGSYSYDSTSNQYLPDKNGSWNIQQQESFDTLSASRVRKQHLGIDWDLRPPKGQIKGLMADLEWKGLLNIDEHRDIVTGSGWRTFVPGWSSVAGLDTAHIRYAQCSYKQEIIWRPSFQPILSTRLSGRPYLNRLPGTAEKGLELLGNVSLQKEKWNTSLDLSRTSIQRAGYSSNVAGLKDMYLSLTEERKTIRSLWVTGTETFGKAAAKDFPGGYYWRLKPGLSLRPKEIGRTDLSYTISGVDSENLTGPIEYPMAAGFANGISQQIDFRIDINTGKHMSVSGSYRGESGMDNGKWLHVMSLEARAYL